MALLGFQSSRRAFPYLLTILFLSCGQIHRASSVLLSGLKNHHGNHHQRKPLVHPNQTTCALFMGAWVRDDSYPVYQSSACPIVDPQFNCQMYGRPDSDYLKLRWQPANCELPRWVICIYRKLCSTLSQPREVLQISWDQFLWAPFSSTPFRRLEYGNTIFYNI